MISGKKKSDFRGIDIFVIPNKDKKEDNGIDNNDKIISNKDLNNELNADFSQKNKNAENPKDILNNKDSISYLNIIIIIQFYFIRGIIYIC